METTLTMAGLQADAGAARLRAAAPHSSCLAAAAPAVLHGTAPAYQVFGVHQSATWTEGVIAKPATFMVLDRKNRPTRPLSERSP